MMKLVTLIKIFGPCCVFLSAHCSIPVPAIIIHNALSNRLTASVAERSVGFHFCQWYCL